MRGVFVGFVLGVAAAFVPSCGAPACNASTCAMGCCDTMGRCQAGTLASACGKAGATCASCATGQSCTLQVCGGLAATGGGAGGSGGGFSATGGGSAGGPGGGMSGGAAGGMAGGAASDAGIGADGGCPLYGDVVETDPVEGSFTVGQPGDDLEDYEWWTASVAYEVADAGLDSFTAELYFEKAAGPPTFPYTGALPANVTFGNCSECFTAQLDCNEAGDTCPGGTYLARAGSFDFDGGTRSIDAGTFQAGGTNLVFREWDFQGDM
ncbi:MAG: hypothetical protein INH41_23275, partial [Myxococcaceae bacterium]|nr:hypothetical protein [Myxococcaceae bacterium]